jgi:hypothetical protein
VTSFPESGTRETVDTTVGTKKLKFVSSLTCIIILLSSHLFETSLVCIVIISISANVTLVYKVVAKIKSVFSYVDNKQFRGERNIFVQKPWLSFSVLIFLYKDLLQGLYRFKGRFYISYSFNFIF